MRAGSKATHISGMTPEASRTYMSALLDRMIRPEIVYHHAWRTGDVLVIDDRATMHRAHGGDGGILASAHLSTERFVEVYERMRANDHRAARAAWADLESLIPLLFKEANPMPIKHCLWRHGLVASPECRLPLTRISEGLAAELEPALRAERSVPAAAPYAARTRLIGPLGEQTFPRFA